MFQNIDAAELQTLLAQQAIVLIDVRTDAEVAQGVIDGARHIPLSALPGQVGEISDAATLVIYCQSGGRSAQACSYLAQQGIGELYNLSGGILGWLRAGNSLTIVTYSRMVFYSLQAAEELSKEDIDVEVIDLRTLNPLDLETIANSVKRTGRALIVTEDTLTAGASAELSALIQEECFDYLEEPVLRLAAEDIPIPVSPALEAGSVPSPARIISIARRLMRRRATGGGA